MVEQLLGGSDLQRVLFQMVDPVLRDQINRRVVEVGLFKFDRKPVSGNIWRVNAVVDGNFRLSGRAEGAKLPGMDPSSSYQDKFSKLATTQMEFTRRYLYTGVDLSGPARNAPKTPDGGFENVAKLILKDTAKNIPESVSRCLATGQGCILGQIASISGNTVRIEPANAPGSAALAYPWAGNRFFRKGMVLDCINGSSVYGALRTGTGDRGRLVDDVSPDVTSTSCTITMNNILTAGPGGTANGWTAGDLLVDFNVRQTAAVTTSTHYSEGLYNPQGIMDAVDDGTDTHYSNSYYGGLLVSSYRTLQSHSITNSALAHLQIEDLNLLAEKIQYDPYGGSEPDMIYTTPSVRRKMMSHVLATVGHAGTGSDAGDPRSGVSNENPVRLVNPGKGANLNLGFKGVEVTTIGEGGSKIIYSSPFAPHYRAYYLARETMLILEDRPSGFIDDDGLTLRWLQGEDAFVVLWKWYFSGIINNHKRRSGLIKWVEGDQNNR